MRYAAPIVLGPALVLVGLLTGCEAPASRVALQENGVPCYETEGQPWWSYQFVYHPKAHVYYQPYIATYWWFEDGAWHRGTELPREFQLDMSLAQVVKLQSDTMPFLQHGTVLTMHPCPAPVTPAWSDPEAGAVWYEQRLATVEPTE